MTQNTIDAQQTTAAPVTPQEGGFPPPQPDYIPPPKKKVTSRRKKKIIKRIIAIVVTLAILAGIAYGFFVLFFQKTPTQALTATVYRGMLDSWVQGYGQTRPAESADIILKNKGIVLESYFNMGDLVNEGDPLFVLDTVELDKEIKVIQDKIDKANASIDTLIGNQAELLNNLVLSAPFSGKLLDAASIKVGDKVSIGTPVGKLVDDRTMLLKLYFSYAYEYDIKVGQTAVVSIPASMATVDGKVQKINKVRRITPEGAILFEVEISIKNPGALTADMAATATLSDGDVIPAEAGKLEYSREQELFIKAPGTVTSANLLSWADYNAGSTLVSLEYQEDNEQVEKLREEIRGYEEEIALKSEGYVDFQMVAPMSGMVMYNNLMVGEMADITGPVMGIAQNQKMIIEANIDEMYAYSVKPGMQVEVLQWTMNGQQSYFGIVKSMSVAGKFEGGMGSFPAVFEVDNFDGTLMSGGGVDYKLMADQRMDILIAPVEAVKNVQEGTVLFIKADTRPENAIDPVGVKVPDGFYAVLVECGLGNETGIEIMSGVEEGAEVFTQEVEVTDDGSMNGGNGGMVRYG